MELCVIRGYALSEVCLMRGSTVTSNFANNELEALKHSFRIASAPISFCFDTWKLLGDDQTMKFFCLMCPHMLLYYMMISDPVPVHMVFALENKASHLRIGY
jgi:hypothetical protein